MIDLSGHRLSNDMFAPDVLLVTVPLVAVTKDDAFPFGTAVVVAPYLAVTAKHVIDAFFRKIAGVEPYSGIEAQFEIGVFQPLADGVRGVWWKVNRIQWLASIDIAWLELRARTLPEDFAWPSFLKWNIAPPFVGSKLTAHGYANTKAVAELGDTQGFFIHGQCWVSDGIVRAVYENRRDEKHNTFPCLELAARYLGAMSGGPVLNENRELVGLVCSDFALLAEDEKDPICYASLIYPALAVPLSVDLSRPDDGSRYALELAAKGEIQVAHVEDFVFEADKSGVWQSFAINYERRPGLPDSHKLRRVESEQGRSILEATFADAPVLTGQGHITYTCSACDSILAANLYDDQVFDVCLRCGRCGVLGTFPPFDRLPRRVPICSMGVGKSRVGQPIPVPGNILVVGRAGHS